MARLAALGSKPRSRLGFAASATVATIAGTWVASLELVKAASAPSTPSIIAFDIAAQPLSSALDAFSAVTGLQLVYDGALAQGRRSNAVFGTMSPQEALRGLLAGSGLMPVRGSDAFTVIPSDAAGPPKQTLAGLMPYLGAMQASLASAFCRLPETRPGSYATTLEFWIGPSGQILKPHLFGSTDPARDQAIVRLLGDLSIQHPPPDLPQPIIIAIGSRPPAETGDCAPERGGAPAQARARHD